MNKSIVFNAVVSTGILLVIMKFYNIIDWPWPLVLMPFWWPPVYRILQAMLRLVLYVVLHAAVVRLDKMKEKQ